MTNRWTDRPTELRWLRCATAVVAVAHKNGATWPLTNNMQPLESQPVPVIERCYGVMVPYSQENKLSSELWAIKLTVAYLCCLASLSS